jgi:hypothetical protein
MRDGPEVPEIATHYRERHPLSLRKRDFGGRSLDIPVRRAKRLKQLAVELRGLVEEVAHAY